MNAENVKYFHSFGVDHIPKEIKKFIGNKNIIAYIYRIQAYDLIMWWYFLIGFIDLMLRGKSLLKYAIYFLLMNIKDWQLNIKIFSIVKKFFFVHKIFKG